MSGHICGKYDSCYFFFSNCQVGGFGQHIELGFAFTNLEEGACVHSFQYRVIFSKFGQLRVQLHLKRIVGALCISDGLLWLRSCASPAIM